MRSRYSAYALGLATYLHSTLDVLHEDHHMLADDFADMIAAASQRVTYRSLNVIYGRDTPDSEEGDAEVLFIAGLLEGVRDVGFAELSFFTKSQGRYSYQRGILVPSARLPTFPSALTRESFKVLATPHMAMASTG
jgi:uncharacterized protein YchJ